jgi:outer membrane protein TolC
MRSIRFVSLTLALGFAAAAPAQEISESDALARVAAEHPALAMIEAGRERAAAERKLAGLVESPELSATRESPSGLATQTDVALAWRPPLDGRRGLATEAADAGIEAANFEAAAARLRVRTEVRAAFATWWAAAVSHAALSDHARRVGALAERARTRAAAGEESGLAARRLGAEAAQAGADAATAFAEVGRARAALALWLGDLATGAVASAPPLPAEPPALDVALRADLAALAAEVRRRELETDLAGRVIRFPELTAGWQRVEQGGSEHTGLLAGIRWEVPLPGQGSGGRARAGAELSVARAQLALATARAGAELEAERAAFGALRGAAEAAATAGREADRLVEAAELAFTLGEGDVTDTLDTLRAALGARLRAAETRARALSAHRALELACGQELILGGGR